MNRVVVVGVGRMGGALALALKGARWPVSVLPRSSASKAWAKKARLQFAGEEELLFAELCVFAVPDDAVASAAHALEHRLDPKTALVHCSGALSLDAFLQQWRARGSFHPLVAISDRSDSLEGGHVAIAASKSKVAAALQQLAKAARLQPFRVPEAKRAAYHAGAVLSAGLVVTLIDAAVAATGLPRKQIEPALLHLTGTALRGARERGLQPSLTGPIVRGDARVVAKHLAALPEEVAPLYRALSLRMLTLAAHRLDADARERLAAVLLRP